MAAAACSLLLHCHEQTEAGSGKEAGRRRLSRCWWPWRFGFGLQRIRRWDLCWLCAAGPCARKCTSANERERTRVGWGRRKSVTMNKTCLFSLTSIRSEAVCRISSTSLVLCSAEIERPCWMGSLDDAGMQLLGDAVVFTESDSSTCVMLPLLAVWGVTSWSVTAACRMNDSRTSRVSRVSWSRWYRTGALDSNNRSETAWMWSVTCLTLARDT